MWSKRTLSRVYVFLPNSTIDFTTADVRMVSLTPSQKKATVGNLGDLPQEVRDKHANYLAEIKRRIEGESEPLGQKEIDGQLVQGFRVTSMGISTDIWVDPETVVPVMIEGEIPGMGKTKMTDFEFDVELDDDLFDMTIPEGYTVQTMDMDMGNVVEEDLVEGLRFLAELNDNVFPPSPMLTSEMLQNMVQKGPEMMKQEFGDRKPSEQEGMEYAQKFAMKLPRMMMFIQAHEQKTFQYTGDGVQLGDAQSPVCWYKPKDSETYRVIYGDLHVEDVAEGDLPEVPAEVPTGE